jgi:predicted amidohydrolase YtcJ
MPSRARLDELSAGEEQAVILHPDDVPRFARLGVIASMEPPHCVEDKTWAEDRLGPVRVVKVASAIAFPLPLP